MNLHEMLIASKLRGGGGSGGGGGEEWIGDGNTHIWISLHEGRTSPMLGVCPNGTVTVDWGDGSEPDVLTGTSTNTVKWTPNHEYGKAGDYIITLTVDGLAEFSGMGNEKEGSYILRHSSEADARNATYQTAVQKIEVGNNVQKIGMYAFVRCYNLTSINIPDGVTTIDYNSFYYCHSLISVAIPNGVTTTGNKAFSCCYNLTSINIPDSVTTIDYNSFYKCYSLTSIAIPDSVTLISSSAFDSCYGVAYYDFTKHTAVPTLAGTNAFNGISPDCQIRVPAALVDEWKAATNWSTYADHIVGV